MYKHYNTDTALCINSRNVGSGTACVVIPVLGLHDLGLIPRLHARTIVWGLDQSVLLQVKV